MTLLEDEAAAETPDARAALPLSGVRVVDLSTSYAGPTATMYLADLGAEVIKVERPGRGDDARGWGPPFTGGTSAWFASANRNKRSVVLDLRSPGARRVLDRLLGAADVFVENLNPAKLDGLGLGPQKLRARYPRLVYCALSGFGLDGPDATLPGYDLVAQARSGLMSVTGALDGAPQRVSTALSDIVAGMSAALAITAALRRQERTGLGDLVDVALLESDLALMAPRIAAFLAGEPEPRPSGGTDSVLAVYQPFATEDRPIVLAVGSEAIWRRLCGTLGLDGLADDPALASNAGRRAERERIVAAIQRRLRTAGAEEWLERLAAAGVPAAPVQRLAEVVADRQVAARGSVLRLDGAGGPHFAVRSPWRLGAADPPARPAPPLGADTEAVLREHGFSGEEIDRLASERAVQIGAEVARDD